MRTLRTWLRTSSPRTVEAARAIPQIRAVGFDSVEAFVADTVRHIDSIWLPSKTSQLVTLQSEERGKAVFIELKPAESGDYYRVNTAFPTPRSYAEKKEQKEGWVKLWDRMALQSSAPAAQSPSAEQLSKDAGESAAPPSGQSDSSVANPDAEGSTLRICDDQALFGTGKILSTQEKTRHSGGSVIMLRPDTDPYPPTCRHPGVPASAMS